jgi:AraC family transcriptional regulator, activator of mtrCDE
MVSIATSMVHQWQGDPAHGQPQRQQHRSVRRLAHLPIDEIGRPGPGQRALLDNLADALFTMAVRHHLQSAPVPRGLLAALADSRLRPVVNAIHEQPGRDWTLGALAQI